MPLQHLDLAIKLANFLSKELGNLSSHYGIDDEKLRRAITSLLKNLNEVLDLLNL